MLREALGRCAHQYALPTKAKLLISFYQIVAQIPSIYAVVLPDSSRYLLAAFDAGVSIGLDAVGVPLQCLGLHGYLPRLIFFMVAPLVKKLVYAAGCLAAVDHSSDATSDPLGRT